MVTEIRWSSARDTFIIAVSVHLVLYIYSSECSSSTIHL